MSNGNEEQCGNWGGHGGLEVKAKIAEQRQWDGQGSPPRQWGKVTPPYQQHCLTDYQLIPDCVMTLCVRVHVHNHWVPERVACMLKAASVKIRIVYRLSFNYVRSQYSLFNGQPWKDA